MNAEQRAALVEELADAIYRGTLEGEGGIDDGHYQDEFYPYLDGFARSMANDVLPIIDRILASRDIDAMLDEIGGELLYVADGKKGPASPRWYKEPPAESRYTAKISVRRDQADSGGYWVSVYLGTGITESEVEYG